MERNFGLQHAYWTSARRVRVQPEDEELYMEEFIKNKKTVFKTRDPLGQSIEVCEGLYNEERMRLLLVDGAMQSAQYLDPLLEDELAFEYMREFEWAFRLHPSAQRVLLIGGGGFAYPRFFLKNYPEKSIDVIELSPTIVEIAREYFGLRALEAQYPDRLRVIVGDGHRYLEKLSATFTAPDAPAGAANAGDREAYTAAETKLASKEEANTAAETKLSSKEETNSATASNKLRYDTILNDAYIGYKSSASMQASAQLFHQCLTDGGLYAANMVTALRGLHSIQMRREQKNFQKVFAYTFLMQCDDEISPFVPQNNIFFASDAAFEM